MFFRLSDEQREMRSVARAFAEREIAPNAERWDEEERFPRELLRPLAELGLTGIAAPEALGGLALSRLTSALIYEEVGRADMSTAVWLGVHNMVTGLIAQFGDEEQRRRWVPALANGEALGAFALSEAQAGSDAANIQASARREGDAYILNGSKFWITSAGEADVYVVMARTSGADAPARGKGGVSAFVVEKGTPGFTFGKRERKMGLHASPTGELLFADCRIPTRNRLGEEGQGLHIALSALDGGRVTIGAITTGMAQAALDVATQYARERHAFGEPIGVFQGVQFLLADMATKIEAARLLVYEAAYTLDEDDPPAPAARRSQAAAMAKLFATDSAMEVTTNAVQVLGGAGYVRDWPVERYMRDAKVGQIFEGTNQIQRIVIARALLGKLSSK